MDKLDTGTVLLLVSAAIIMLGLLAQVWRPVPECPECGFRDWYLWNERDYICAVCGYRYDNRAHS